MPKRIWQIWTLFGFSLADMLARLAIFLYLLANGESAGLLLFDITFGAATCVCLLAARRAGWLMMALNCLMSITVQNALAALVSILFFAYPLYLLCTRAVREYCRIGGVPATGEERERQREFLERERAEAGQKRRAHPPALSGDGDETGPDALSDAYLQISRRANRYEGLRVNAAPDVLAGPSPHDLMASPPDAAGLDPLPYCDEPFNPAIDTPPAVPLRRRGRPALPGEPAWESYAQGGLTACFPSQDTPPSFRGYDPVKLLEASDAYSYLKDDAKLRGLYTRVFEEALRDLDGFPGPAREGRAGLELRQGKNKLLLTLSLHEQPGAPPLLVRAALYLNE